MAAPLAAIVLAAGKGTRMKSARPKVLHEIAGRPLIDFPVTLALELGADPVAVVLGHGLTEVEAALTACFGGQPGKRRLRIVPQIEQKGTAHAVISARKSLAGFTGTLLILYGDVPLLTIDTLRRLLSAKTGPLSFLTTRPPDPHGYGRVVRTSEGSVARVVEQRDCSPADEEIREVNAGIYRVDSKFLWKSLDRIGTENAQGEFYLTDLVALAAAAGGATAVLADFEEVGGVNDRCELSAAAARLRARINREHQLAGVTLMAPMQTFIDSRVKLEPDVVLEPGCVLMGSTVISAGARIRAYSVLEDAVVGPRCVVGPFARLRPGTVLEADVHVGNFVETKNAKLGARTKANHLTYLGDAVIGAGVNVGAGTITCNYDGFTKHETRLGDGVFIGSDTQLVAPVKVGDGAYVAAGTTVTEDVPPDALAVSRVAQVNVGGWATRHRTRLAAPEASSAPRATGATGRKRKADG
jgi:bifunctional UDP-N-acetylglucosamine pyrophosphorylase/glucosamine-1-phosphate N-acetyltransferase